MWFGRKKKGPPSVEDVARRVIALRHVVTWALGLEARADPETVEALPPERLAELRTATESMRDTFWTELGPHRDELTPWERSFAETTLITISERKLVDASWRIESLQVLLWAVGAIDDLPPWNERARHDLADPNFAAMGKKFFSLCKLRSRGEIEAARELAEMWHWRSRTRQIIEAGQALQASPELQKAGLNSYDDIVRMTAKHGQETGKFSTLDEDFAVGGKAYRDLSSDEWAEVRSITVERHFALNWLCGRAPSNEWDETPTDT